MHIGGHKDKECNVGMFLKNAVNDVIRFFQADEKLYEFNKKFSVNILNRNVIKLDLYQEGINNEGLKLLSDNDFNQLKE